MLFVVGLPLLVDLVCLPLLAELVDLVLIVLVGLGGDESTLGGIGDSSTLGWSLEEVSPLNCVSTLLSPIWICSSWATCMSLVGGVTYASCVSLVGGVTYASCVSLHRAKSGISYCRILG